MTSRIADRGHAGREVRGARSEIAQGGRPAFHVRYRRDDDDVFHLSVAELPGVHVTATTRKGIQAAARARIALVLDVPADAFDLAVSREP